MKGTKDYLSHQNVPGSSMKIINNNKKKNHIIKNLAKMWLFKVRLAPTQLCTTPKEDHTYGEAC